MNTKKILFILGGGLAGATLLRYLYRNVMLAKEWDYNVDNFKLVEVTPSLKANMYFTIINKSNFTAKVKDIDMKVFTMGKELSQIKQPQEIDIAPDGKTSIYVSILGNPVSLYKNWKEILAQILTTNDIELDFVGNMKLKTPFGWTTVPIKFSNTGKNLYNLYNENY